MNLQSGNALLAGRGAPECKAPMTQGNTGILEYGTGADAELAFAASAPPAEVFLPLAVTGPHHVNIHITTVRAAWMVAPSVFFHELDSRGFIGASGWKLLDWAVVLRGLVLYLAHDYYYT